MAVRRPLQGRAAPIRCVHDDEGALPLYEEELRLKRRTNGSEHPRTLIAIFNAGQIQ